MHEMVLCPFYSSTHTSVHMHNSMPSSHAPPWHACLQELAGKLAMQVVGAAPRFLDRAAVPAEALAAETSLLREQALKSGEGAGVAW